MANPLATTNEEALEQKLGELRSHGAEDRYRVRADRLGLPFSDLTGMPIGAEAITILPEAIAREASVAVIFKNGKQLTVAVTAPDDPKTMEILTGLETRGFAVTVVMTSPEGLTRAFERYAAAVPSQAFETGSIDIAEEELDSLQHQITGIGGLQRQVSAVSATKLLEILIAGALKTGASDIHFEPEAGTTRLRYRLDGVLQDIARVDPDSYRKALNRIKVLARLKLNVHGSPQDGRFTIRQESVAIEVRVSVLPSEHGETIVMRLLDPRAIKNGLEDLGLRPDFLALVKSQLEKPTGAILTTGPTGSGKTTTLYAFVNHLNEPGSKIITIEDPIEYHLKGVSQTQVEPDRGYSFANGLRAIVRQDPDIILVGEIRDAETAEIALNAALTGHLVLSTIHTNDAAGTVPRLIDLKVSPEIIAPAIRMTMAQRLVRTICPACAKERPATAKEMVKLKEVLATVAKRLAVPNLAAATIREPVGCLACGGLGYKGRVGVFEAFLVGPEMEKLILTGPSVSAIRDLAVQEGMVTMLQDAYLKVLAGATTLTEVQRVLG